jgi:hypothetical protein
MRERSPYHRLQPPPASMWTWPEGKRFAFTIVDDTDFATVAKVRPVYDFLLERGIRTTKTVWPLANVGTPVTGGSSLEEPEYREWILRVAASGVEIALHGVADGSSPRGRIIAGLERFHEIFGTYPRLHANHTGQRENIYWGEARLDGLARLAYLTATRARHQHRQYSGHQEASQYFWGDVCRERITYVRNFVFRDINTTRRDPVMPYHDARRPYVPYWFSSSEGAGPASFCDTIREGHQDRLLEEGGGCIMYTHFGARGFVKDGRIHPEFVRLMGRLASLPGWFVPASTLLDHLRCRPTWAPECGAGRLRGMQWSWLGSKLIHGSS